MRGAAGNILLDFHVAEYQDALLTFADESVRRLRGPLDLTPFDVNAVERAFAEPWDLHHYQHDWLSFYDPEQIAARQARWAREHAEQARAQVERVPARIKIGRNDPCPCGSGLKYKKCCLA